ncbi:GNAT family N-acetyltransferase [Streptomyces sp. G44]|uniref:GNAT family N-acetyltransferase n=1 Tax=Streptomyces sp. G44 TaxID=2807632 RepID=UPI001960B0DE|nr:GNAT family N-acetyltransferase [Streptomyces sp. G44]MBM7170365.1 GNAT family N-acetyltransferase [Streptomyces sp. G44]
MIELPLHRLPAAPRWFSTGAPGPASLHEHVTATGVGAWWGDHALRPRAVAVSCAGHVLLSGDPGSVAPAFLAPFAHSHVEAPVRFLPVLGAAFDRVIPVERMVYVHREPAVPSRPPHGVTVRRLGADDAAALAALSPDAAWIYASWGGPAGLAASGHAWGAVDRDGRLAAVACGYFVGDAYEDVAVLTVPERRREHLALTCVTSLCADIAARGRTASWSCGRDNRPSRLLAWNAGFRLHREYVRYATGTPAARPRHAPRVTA